MLLPLKRVAAVAISFTLGVIVGWAVLPQPIGPLPDRARWAGLTPTSTASVLFDYGDGRVVTYADLPLTSGQTAWKLMRQLELARDVKLEFQDYGGDLGVLVTGIGGVRSDAQQGKFWHYWVNQRFAKVGVSQYRLNPGDQVMWKYTASQFKAETR